MDSVLHIAKKYRSQLIFILANAIFLALVYQAVKRQLGLLYFLPFVLMIGVMAIENFRNVWYLAVFLMPLSLGLGGYIPGANIQVPTDLLAVGLMLLLIMKMITERKFLMPFYEHPIFWAICAYWGWLFFSSFASTMPGVSFKAVIAYTWIIAAFYCLSVLVFRNPKTILHFFWLIAFGFILAMCVIIFFYVSSGRNPFGLRFNPGPFFSDHTVFGAFTAILVPIFFLFTFRGNFSRNYRIMSVFALAFLVMGLFFSYSRGAWMSTLMGLGLMGMWGIRGWIRKYFIPLTTLLIGVVAYLYFTWPTEYTGHRDSVSRKNFYDHVASVTNFKTDDSNAERINRWVSAVEMWKERRWFGHGLGTYAMLYGDFQFAKNRTLISTNRGDNGTAHNEFLLALSETGWPGPVFLFLMFLVPIWRGFRGYLRARTPNVRLIYQGVTFGLITYFFHAMVNNFLDQDKVGVTWFGMLAVITALDIYILRAEKSEREAGEY